MSTPSRNERRQTAATLPEKIKEQNRLLRDEQEQAGLTPHPRPGPANHRCTKTTVAEEREERIDLVTEQIRIIRAQLPVLLERFTQIPDPRQPKKIKHSLTLLMVFGIVCFVLQIGSRREATRELSFPQIQENLRLLLPELDTTPHADTLYRLLRGLGKDVNEIENALIALIQRLIRKKKFCRYLINKHYPIAIDGSRKLGTTGLWSEALLEQRLPLAQGETEPRYQYYVYVIEASLSFANGMVLPLMSEFLDYREGDGDRNKQDCETRAFHRLAARIKKAFPRLPILLLLDGLYANGPVMQRIYAYSWQFMIVLKDESLPTVWEEYRALATLNHCTTFRQNWGNREQLFHWVNNIRYEFGPNDQYHLSIHVVTCMEQWREINKHAHTITQQSRHAWLSSEKLNPNNLHSRCNLGARYRWGIEAGFLVEKHQGYSYEHLFARDWHALRGYHYLMRLAHFLNTLARFAATLAPKFREWGVRGFLRYIRQTLSGPWFTPEEITQRLMRPFSLRLT